MPLPSPCLFERRILPKVWGGSALREMLRLPPDPDTPGAIGETWEVFDRPEGSSRLRDEERTLADLMREDRGALLGRRVAPTVGGRFPLLLKFIDATDRLSVQVHPDDALARRHGAADGGKNEAWVVVHAGPNARIVRGLAPGVTREQFAEVASTAAVEPLLHGFRPTEGDVVHLPAGIVHAIGPDVVLFEIQQNSDLTYRIYDWGRDRELHLERALESFRQDDMPDTVTPRPAPGGGEWLVQDPFFNVRRVKLTTQTTLPTDGICKLLTVLQGRCTLGWRSQGVHEPLLLEVLDTALVPACVESVFLSPIGATTVLWSGPVVDGTRW